jgi:hypothetical protein
MKKLFDVIDLRTSSIPSSLRIQCDHSRPKRRSSQEVVIEKLNELSRASPRRLVTTANHADPGAYDEKTLQYLELKRHSNQTSSRVVYRVIQGSFRNSRSVRAGQASFLRVAVQLNSFQLHSFQLNFSLVSQMAGFRL